MSKPLSAKRLRWGGDLMGCGLHWKVSEGKNYITEELFHGFNG